MFFEKVSSVGIFHLDDHKKVARNQSIFIGRMNTWLTGYLTPYDWIRIALDGYLVKGYSGAPLCPTIQEREGDLEAFLTLLFEGLLS